MKFTIGWLKEHLDTKFKDNEIIEKLTDVGLEVESFEKVSSDLDNFKVAKIINAEQHPNADKLKVCDVDIGEQDPVKVVCGAPNAKKDLLTVYAGPGSVIPKNNMKLTVSKIRGVTSYGMLCSESELNLSDESDGITELKSNKYSDKVGKNFFKNKNNFSFDMDEGLLFTHEFSVSAAINSNTASITNIQYATISKEELKDLILKQLNFKKESHYLELGETGLTNNLSVTGG